MNRWTFRAVMAMLALYSGQALASGHLEDKIADVVVWVVVIMVPIVGISAFWFLHIWPERVAEEKHHPQASAIQALCLMSLVFGGLLWPLAMLWAYMKPMEFRLARDEDGHPGPLETGNRVPVGAARDDEAEVTSLRQQVATLHRRVDALSAPTG